MGSSSQARDQTQASCIGSSESYPLDHQGSPQSYHFSAGDMLVTSSVCHHSSIRKNYYTPTLDRWGNWGIQRDCDWPSSHTKKCPSKVWTPWSSPSTFTSASETGKSKEDNSIAIECPPAQEWPPEFLSAPVKPQAGLVPDTLQWREEYLFFLMTNWSVVDLQCYVSFRCTAKRFSYTYISIFKRFFSHIDYYKILSIVPCAIH